VRAGVLASLSEHALSGAQQALLRPTSRLGQRETLREGLSRALRHERMGLPLPDGVPLLRERRDVEAEAAEAAAETAAAEGSGSEEEETRAPRAPRAAPPQAVVAPAAAAAAAAAAPSADPFAGGALAALAARAMGTKARKPDRQSLKRHKLDADADDAAADADADGAEPAPRMLAAAAPGADALRPLARALRADVTGEAEGVADDPNASSRAARRAALVARPPDAPKIHVVHPRRPADVAAARLKLPILAMEQEIMEAITENDVVVLCGETGCGKTTQVPQFLYEAGYGSRGSAAHAGAVCVTQPRRVAVTSTAARVAAELGEPRLGGAVGYAVRHDTSTAAHAPLRFVTDGVLLREAQSDLLLSRYSAVIIDEAHERSVNTDLLIGLLSRIVPLRAHLADAAAAAGEDAATAPTRLKLVVMSATLRVDDFAANPRLCPIPPPVLRVPARQFPVTVHFARRTAGHDFVGAAFRKVCAIHAKLPPGGILVFLTGQREVEHLAARLRKELAPKPPPRKKGDRKKEETAAETTPADADAEEDADEDGGGEALLDALGADAFDRDALDAAAEADEAALDAAFADDARDGADDDGSGSDADADEEATVQLGGDLTEEELAAAAAADAAEQAAHTASQASGVSSGPGPVHVLPLYALLPPAAQARVFAPPPPGARLIVIATNVAETSLTIPGIRYVVDAGRAKSRVFAPNAAGGGLSRFEVRWISQASAAQRAGRAGRTGPGHAYRLYSSAHYTNELRQHAPPELLCVPLDGVVLQMKAIGIDRVANFPFPSPPDAAALREAETALTRLGALEEEAAAASGNVVNVRSHGGALTALGRGMALLPVAPRAARMLLAVAGEARCGALLPHAAAVAAALSLETPFVKRGGPEGVPEGGEDAEAPPPADADADPNILPPRRVVATGADTAAAERLAWERRGRGRHAAYAHPRSDALSAVNALLAFEAAAAGPDGAAAADALCAADSLHARTLREMADLRSQLARLLARHAAALCGAAAEASAEARAARGEDAEQNLKAADAAAVAAALQAGPPAPGSLSGGAERALRRAIAAGWGDRVARRVKPREQARTHACACASQNAHRIATTDISLFFCALRSLRVRPRAPFATAPR
jgi:ATP-dependent RNA helicase DHX37/DHR1